MFKKILMIGAILAMAIPASAQGFSFSFGKKDRKRAVHVGVSVDHGVRVHAGFLKSQRHGRRHGGRYGRTNRGRTNRGRPVLRHRHNHAPRYRIVTERVWIAGCSRRVYVPAQYGYRYDRCGRRIRYCIAPACWKVVQTPGRWEYRTRKIYC